MKPTSLDLYQLIRACSHHEKAWFRNYAHIHTHSKSPAYLWLFETIVAAPEIDEQAFKTAFAEHYPAANFAPTKAHLSTQLMRAMLLFHKDDDVEIRLEVLLSQILITYRKGLHRLSRKLLDQALEMAAIAHNNYKLQRLLHIQIRLLLANGFAGVQREAIDEGFEALEENHRHLKATMFYYSEVLRDQYQFRRAMNEKGPDRAEVIQKILNRKKDPPPTEEVGFYARLAYISTGIVTASVMGDLPKALEINTQRLEILGAEPRTLRASHLAMYNFLMATLNQCILQYYLEGYENMAEVLAKLESFKNAPVIRASEQLSTTFHYVFNRCHVWLLLKKGQFEKALPHVRAIEKRWENMQRFLNPGAFGSPKPTTHNPPNPNPPPPTPKPNTPTP
ncbi:MAG: hypothetical protein AAF570_21685, partial [Bacteroidota bacterium]